MQFRFSQAENYVPSKKLTFLALVVPWKKSIKYRVVHNFPYNFSKHPVFFHVPSFVMVAAFYPPLTNTTLWANITPKMSERSELCSFPVEKSSQKSHWLKYKKLASLAADMYELILTGFYLLCRTQVRNSIYQRIAKRARACRGQIMTIIGPLLSSRPCSQ